MTDRTTTVRCGERRPINSRISWERFVAEAMELIDISQQLNDGWEWKVFDSVSRNFNIIRKVFENTKQYDQYLSDIGVHPREGLEREKSVTAKIHSLTNAWTIQIISRY